MNSLPKLSSTYLMENIIFNWNTYFIIHVYVCVC